MTCPKCNAGTVRLDIDGRPECPACLWHPDSNDEIDLATIGDIEEETADELEQRHTERLNKMRNT